MILFCYDGSADAETAIDHVAKLMPGGDATVVTIWERYIDAALASGPISLSVAYDDGGLIDVATQQRAAETATEGAQRATDAGLVAQWRVASRNGDVAHAILEAAADVDADVVECGTRGRGGVKSFLLGSVSQGLEHNADRAVRVVPSSALAAKRRSRTRQATADGKVAVATATEA